MRILFQCKFESAESMKGQTLVEVQAAQARLFSEAKLSAARPWAGGAERPRRPGAGPALPPTHYKVAWTPAPPPTALQSCLASSLIKVITGNMVTSSSWNLEFYIAAEEKLQLRLVRAPAASSVSSPCLTSPAQNRGSLVATVPL